MKEPPRTAGDVVRDAHRLTRVQLACMALGGAKFHVSANVDD
jgi:hypothetical protein